MSFFCRNKSSDLTQAWERTPPRVWVRKCERARRKGKLLSLLMLSVAGVIVGVSALGAGTARAETPPCLASDIGWELVGGWWLPRLGKQPAVLIRTGRGSSDG